MKDQRRKKTYKNKLWFGAHISQYRTEKLLRCFANDMTAEAAATESGVSHVTVKKAYNEFRNALFFAALAYRQLFNSAGALMMLGVPPSFPALQAEASRRRKRRVKWNDVYVWEQVVRAYAGYKFTEAEIIIVLTFGLLQMARLDNILLVEYRDHPQFSGLLPVDVKQEMPEQKFKDLIENVSLSEYVRRLWRAGIEEKFIAHPNVWPFFFHRRQPTSSHKTIYRDLRWYLLKHPIGAKRTVRSPYWDNLPAPTLYDAVEARSQLVRNFKDGKR